MSREWKCPRCDLEIHPGATVCPNCRVDLAHCAWCRDLTTLENADPTRGRLHRTRYRCDRCGRNGVRCRSSLIGSYCNSLARADGWAAKQLCAGCTDSMYGAAKTVVASIIIGVVGSRLRPRLRG